MLISFSLLSNRLFSFFISTEWIIRQFTSNNQHSNTKNTWRPTMFPKEGAFISNQKFTEPKKCWIKILQSRTALERQKTKVKRTPNHNLLVWAAIYNIMLSQFILLNSTILHVNDSMTQRSRQEEDFGLIISFSCSNQQYFPFNRACSRRKVTTIRQST